MAGIDIDWVKEQMTRAKVTRASGDSVLQLMELWNTIDHTHKSAKEAIEVFSKLALGHPIAEDDPPMDGIWIDAQPGNIKVAEVVRVKTDLYDGEMGIVHNGRMCRVVGVRYGDVIVRSIDEKEPLLDGVHYSPHDLQKLVPR